MVANAVADGIADGVADGVANERPAPCRPAMCWASPWHRHARGGQLRAGPAHCVARRAARHGHDAPAELRLR